METNTKVTRGARRRRNSGLSLIELLVALMIFAMLASAGVLLLGNSVSGVVVATMMKSMSSGVNPAF